MKLHLFFYKKNSFLISSILHLPSAHAQSRGTREVAGERRRTQSENN